MPAKNRSLRPAALGQGPPVNGYRLSGRMWIEKRGETFLSWGRITLLEQIRRRRSIAGAARVMGMGYRHAWELVQAMNELSPEPLVAKVAGGVRGGGARLTPAGEAAIEEFWQLVGDFRKWIDGEQLRIAGGGRGRGLEGSKRSRGEAGTKRKQRGFD